MEMGRKLKKERKKERENLKCADTPWLEKNGIMKMHPCQTKATEKKKKKKRKEKKMQPEKQTSRHKKQKEISRTLEEEKQLSRCISMMMTHRFEEARLAVSKLVAGSSLPDSLLLAHHSPPRPSPAARVFLQAFHP